MGQKKDDSRAWWMWLSTIAPPPPPPHDLVRGDPGPVDPRLSGRMTRR